jgi:hypothetical protein
MQNSRSEFGDAEVLGGEVVRGDAAPNEQEDNTLDAAEAIRARAYELYLQRGEREGDDVNDWLEAEREYRERRGQSDAADVRDQPGL